MARHTTLRKLQGLLTGILCVWMVLIYVNVNIVDNMARRFVNLSFEHGERDFFEHSTTTPTPLFEPTDDFPLQPEHVNITGNFTTNRYLTIGIPTVPRDITGNEYLKHTLRSLVRHITGVERDEVTILIFLADFNRTSHLETMSYLKSEYSQFLASGFMVIMEVDQSAYPALDNLPRNYNDSTERVKWRSKQVVDYAYMFWVGRTMAQYYMQIEDDVISSQKLLGKIRAGIARMQNKKWTTLEFCFLGFIGKLYKSQDLEQFAKFLIVFYWEQPIDWLYKYFFNLREQKQHIYMGTALFQHFGLKSSLKSKPKNVLKERNFQDPDPLDLAEVVIAQ